MNHQDYLAAVDRLRRVESGELSHVVYPGANGPQDKVSDKLTVYDFEHDETPADLDWLWEHCPAGWNAHRVESGLEIFIRTATSFVALTNPTRGDVLTLLRVFGAKL